MPTRRSSYGRQGSRPGRKSFRRRRASVSTRAKYQRPSARNQQRQIQSLARLAVKNARMLRAATSYTDWFKQFNVTQSASLWQADELTNIDGWAAGNRQDADVVVSQNVFLRNMVFEWFCSSETKNQAVEVDMFIVSLRDSASNWTPQFGPTGALTAGSDYNGMGVSNKVELNSGIFKVHYSTQFRLFPRNNPSTVDPTLLDFSGNPYATYKRGKVNIKLNYKVRGPAQLSWKTTTMDQLPPRQRMYVVYRGVSADTVNDYALNWGLHVTAIAQS